jgi:hypothetical protein
MEDLVHAACIGQVSRAGEVGEDLRKKFEWEI